MKRNNRNKYTKTTTAANTRPFVIHGVKDQYKDNPMIKDWINYHTHGLSDYGLTELSIVCPDINDTRPCELINLIGDMMLNGEAFKPDPDHPHLIEDSNGIIVYKFILIPVTCFGEDSLRIILPDKDSNMFIENSPYALQKLDIFTEYENIDE